MLMRGLLGQLSLLELVGCVLRFFLYLRSLARVAGDPLESWGKVRQIRRRWFSGKREVGAGPGGLT